jgi:hypothetical protein
MPLGDYTISWESYGSSATVKFEKNKGDVLLGRSRYVIAVAAGQLVRSPVWYQRDTLVYIRQGGSQTLLQIRLAGTSQALVFAKSS